MCYPTALCFACGKLFHVKRLEKSLFILSALNQARLERSRKDPAVVELELQLRQNDYDARDKVNPRQLSLWEK